MHISKEFLLEAVGLSLVVALILISMQIFQRSAKLTATFEKSQEQQIAELEEYEIVKFDGMQMDGVTVISYIKKMIGTYELPVWILKEKGVFVISDTSQYVSLRDADSELYINPFGKYRCEVIRDENEAISEIKIHVEKEGK